MLSPPPLKHAEGKVQMAARRKRSDGGQLGLLASLPRELLARSMCWLSMVDLGEVR